jgi:hypothetical protein
MIRWHKEERKVDVMLRQPADGSQWCIIKLIEHSRVCKRCEKFKV